MNKWQRKDENIEFTIKNLGFSYFCKKKFEWKLKKKWHIKPFIPFSHNVILEYISSITNSKKRAICGIVQNVCVCVLRVAWYVICVLFSHVQVRQNYIVRKRQIEVFIALSHPPWFSAPPLLWIFLTVFLLSSPWNCHLHKYVLEKKMYVYIRILQNSGRWSNSSARTSARASRCCYCACIKYGAASLSCVLCVILQYIFIVYKFL